MRHQPPPRPQEQAELKVAQDKYRKQLAKLRTSLTKAGKIDAAKEVDAEIRTIRTISGSATAGGD